MTAIILVAMQADHDAVRKIVSALSDADLDIFWDRTEPGSPKWPDAVDRVLEARGAVFFWSPATAGQDAEPYRLLARRALAADKAIAVRLRGGVLPAGLESCTTYDLRGWRARASSLFMLDLVAGVKAKAVGLDPPLPSAPRKLLMRRLAFAVPSVIAAIALFLGLYRDAGLDKIAGPEEAVAWASLRPGSCDDLRSFLGKHSGGVHADEAQVRLNGRRTEVVVRWQSIRRTLPLFVPIEATGGSATNADGQEAARGRAQGEAERLCAGLAEAGSARLRETTVRVDRYECERFGAGASCALDGNAVCAMDEPVSKTQESCGP